jgi:exosome complex RNA-binding protein Rrp42 (RNase PH superfamily)
MWILCVFAYIYIFFVRESRAVDMESLCVVAGKHVWSVRVDLHILDNGGYGLKSYKLFADVINL